jgi:paraquat-inducible protein B
VITSGAPGRLFVLHAERRGSLEIGSPVYFRQIQVGEVVAYHLDGDGSRITFQIFVHAPYHDFVRRDSRFWNASGFDVKLDAKGVRLDTESLVSILVGGIAFDAVDLQAPQAEPAPEQAVFSLFASREAARERVYNTKNRYELHFTTSVRGLSPGAPVEFRGIPLGRVVDVALEFDVQAMAFTIPVLVELEPERVTVTGRAPDGLQSHEVVNYLIGKGLRAQLRTASLLTGQQFVALDFFPEAPAAKAGRSGKLPQIPTIPPPLEEITARLSNLVTKFDRLPLDQIGSDLRDTVQGASRLANSPAWLEAVGALEGAIREVGLLAADLRGRTIPEMGGALAQAERALAAAGSALAAEAPLQTRARQALGEIERAARSLRTLTDYLERHPEALIRGKGGER